MVDGFRARLRRAVGRLRRIEHREWRHLRRRLEETSTLLHLSVLAFVPVLVGVLTVLANRLEGLSFLLFPPLAAGTYMLFANPGEKQATPVRFVGASRDRSAASRLLAPPTFERLQDVETDVAIVDRH